MLRGEKKLTQKHDDFLDLYGDALRSINGLWDVVEAASEEGGAVDAFWGIKRLNRARRKVVEQYQGHPSRLTDVCRAALVFDDLDGLLKALDYLIDNHEPLVIKNRIKKPANSGYADVLLNIMVGDHVCEIQLHVEPVAEEGRSEHNAYLWIRRLTLPEDVYDGDYDEKGQRHGYGTMRYANGDLFEGFWVAGNKEGKGTYRYADGDVYEGEFRNDQKGGPGLYRYSNGEVFLGSFHNDKKDGWGQYWYGNGDRFEGQWKDDRKNGNGVYTYASTGGTYEGFWVNDAKEGLGNFADPDGRVWKGFWKNGRLVRTNEELGVVEESA